MLLHRHQICWVSQITGPGKRRVTERLQMHRRSRSYILRHKQSSDIVLNVTMTSGLFQRAPPDLPRTNSTSMAKKMHRHQTFKPLCQGLFGNPGFPRKSGPIPKKNLIYEFSLPSNPSGCLGVCSAEISMGLTYPVCTIPISLSSSLDSTHRQLPPVGYLYTPICIS